MKHPTASTLLTVDGLRDYAGVLDERPRKTDAETLLRKDLLRRALKMEREP